MPRKSAAALSILPLPSLVERPSPPDTLGEREAELWTAIVDSLPADWFAPGDRPVLAAYVTSVALHERVSRECQTAELMVIGSTGQMRPNPLFRMQDRAAAQIASLSVKLRLSQSTRYDPRKAAAKSNEQGAKKLWAA